MWLLQLLLGTLQWKYFTCNLRQSYEKKKSMENASLVWLHGSATCSDLYSLLSPVMIHWFVILELLKCQCNSCFNSNKNSNLPALAFQRLGTNVSEINFSPQKRSVPLYLPRANSCILCIFQAAFLIIYIYYVLMTF